MGNFDLEKLILEIFKPEPDDCVLLMSDLPHGRFKDHEKWADRRKMAEEWHHKLLLTEQKGIFKVQPLLFYFATGVHNGDLPEKGMMNEREVKIDDCVKESSIILSMADYSASAPLVGYTKKHQGLRVASMPMLERRMEMTGLSADYAKVAMECDKIEALLKPAIGSEVIFSTGHKCHFDLRFRNTISDDGRLSRKEIVKKNFALINLPCGEVCKCPYEGEKTGIPSNTHGQISYQFDGELVVFEVKENRIVDIIGSGPKAQYQKKFFEIDPARRNVAEFAIGCNEWAVVSGNPLEDEKARGFHWAYGRSDQLGGIFGPDKFNSPANVHHLDLSYAEQSPVHISSLKLEYEDGTRKEVIKEGIFLV